MSKIQEYSEQLDKARTLGNHKYDEFVSKYNISEERMNECLNSTHEAIEEFFEGCFSNEEFIKGTISLPEARVNPLDDIKSIQVILNIIYKFIIIGMGS